MLKDIASLNKPNRIMKDVILTLIALGIICPIILKNTTSPQIGVVENVNQYLYENYTYYLVLFKDKNIIETTDNHAGLLVPGDTVEYWETPFFSDVIGKVSKPE